ncbi:MAG TPA: LysR family transcriptional regulator [Lysobacter sp.]|nr:LysR family transcriptional regulator [Lysobacter sp.]
MLDALTLDQLRTFVAIADAGGFRAAALRLRRAQSAVSHAIATLEDALAVRLFDRSGHRPVLTAEGRALLANAREILLRIDALRAHARGLAAGVEPELSLVVDTLFPLDPVVAALGRVREAYPEVALRLSVEPLGGPLQALLEERATVAVVAGEDFRDRRVAHEPLWKERAIAVVAATHPLARRRRRGRPAAAELADHLQIVLTDPTPFSEGRSFGVLSPRICPVGTQDAKHAMILGGLGWGRLPRWLVARDLLAGRLVRLDVGASAGDGESAYPTFLAHRIDAPLGPAARRFADALRALRPR